MTPTQAKDVAAMAHRLWPRCKWTEEEEDVFIEQVERIDIEPAQAEAALRNLKATSEKYPQIATLRKALDNAKNRKALSADAPKPVSTRLTEMARRNGVQPNDSPVEIVVADYRAWARCSVRIRGSCPEEPYYGLFRADMKELANASDREIDEQWYAIVEEALARYQQEPGLADWDVHKIRHKLQRLMKHVEPVKEEAA